MDDLTVLRAAVRSVVPRVSIAERLAPILPDIQEAIDAGASSADLAARLTATMRVNVSDKNLKQILYRNRLSGRLERSPKCEARSHRGAKPLEA